MFDVRSPTSPLFLVLLGASLLFIVFAWYGLFWARLPNMRTSLRGARIAGFLSVISLLLVLLSFQQYYQSLEFFGTIYAIASGLIFLLAITLAERIPD
ncbi:MAG: hypothetical protein JXQ72_05420 [Anaerolineae bacterium]|nr:hypothetical protein [Anaerolineae bacterium]